MQLHTSSSFRVKTDTGCASRGLANQFAMYISQNGTSWSFSGTQTVDMGNCIEVGLVVTNYNPNSTVTANFANVSVTGGNITKPTINTQEDILTAADFSILPNPTNGWTNIELGSYWKRDVKMDIYSLQGKLLRSAVINAAKGRGGNRPVHICQWHVFNPCDSRRLA